VTLAKAMSSKIINPRQKYETAMMISRLAKSLGMAIAKSILTGITLLHGYVNYNYNRKEAI
jgi:hypothetical protein